MKIDAPRRVPARTGVRGGAPVEEPPGARSAVPRLAALLTAPRVRLDGSGACEACRGCGELCDDSGDCCNGNCEQGRCVDACAEGSPCTVPGEQGPCAQGRKVCGDCGFECEQETFAEPESCNGVDDDCDGQTEA